MKMGIAGYQGRVGALLVRELQSGNWPNLDYAGGLGRGDDARALFEKSDAVIDFSVPEATETNIKLAAELGVPMVIGTTGLNAAHEKMIEKAGEKVAIVYAANTSVAVTVLDAVTEKVASVLQDWDLEIIEAHHSQKVDAPSGTALMLGKTAAKARDANFDDHAVLSREGHTGARKDGEIGFSTVRGGDAVGEHSVIFFGEGERLELRQQATNRALYAKGAIRAALWATEQDPAIYSMRDVLGV